ncbi:superoxide reductase [Breznakia sp. PF5-3]|uniref:desulfoferrodoxin family protein n=1 Tax=unclassified Breznakia TaxID=2623764 RepID=UPI0024076696|nr:MULTISPECIES: desulfoferrodoxin family protein [unclassified Breznakia]MDF9824579.1 superoxide reductase [Breznakia sp. PM6-1]MDF9835469.1 superoxide reductase [Breznakia sp. PF5-3]MDF9837879.1 superoxide reductase [Breznakia sp. PFB2-8]MDF9859828.1 superoxide reductase [Breznakia sp. PH5-24]
MKFIKCEDCDSVALVLSDGKVCSGEENELVPNTVDAAQEKHVPYVVKEGNILKVQVGEVEHPMLQEHHIEWILVETKAGSMMKRLNPGEKPYAEFNIEGEEVIAVYEYCNLHGLWKKEM